MSKDTRAARDGPPLRPGSTAESFNEKEQNMGGIVTLIISLLAGAVVVTMTCEAPVAIVTVCGVVVVTAIVAKAMGKL
jgi:hypothetical protein